LAPESRSSSRGLALVTGASGVLGPLLVDALLERGARVRVFCRQPLSSFATQAGVEVHAGDIREEGAVLAATQGVSTVFHLAGLLHETRRAAPDSVYEAVNVDGTRHVSRAAARCGAAVILFSTIAVYGATTEPADEETPVAPSGAYAITKRRAEEIVQRAGIPASVLRLAAVYGSRMKGNYPRLVDALRRRRFIAVGDGSNRRTLVHQDDVVRAALLAAGHVGDAPGVYNVTDGRTHSMREILAAISAALGRPAPRLRVPAGVARALARPLGYGAMLDKYLENVEVKGDRIQHTLGFEPRFGLLDGWKNALAGKASS
jgi:nucleoside-diphosphate-sugar epimerase